MSVAGFDLKVPVAFTIELQRHCAKGLVLTLAPLCHCCSVRNRRKHGGEYGGYEMSFCCSYPGAVTLGSGKEGSVRISNPEPGEHSALWPVASAARVRGAVAGCIPAVWDGVAWVGCWGMAIMEISEEDSRARDLS